MKKSIFLFAALLFPLGTFASVEDTSLIDALQDQAPKQIQADFSLQSFQSCREMEWVLWDYIKEYWKNNKNSWGYPIRWGWWEIAVDDMMVMEMDGGAIANTNGVNAPAVEQKTDFSQTNTQVLWVDESDIVKTDGKYIYYYNETQKAVIIASVWDQKVVKKIQVPTQFYTPVLYLADGTLTIVSSGYSQTDYSKWGFWIDRNSKTYVIVYNIKNPTTPVLEKLYMIDGSMTQSRRIGDYVYVLSNNSFQIPYYTFQTEENIDLSAGKILPKKTDLSRTSVPSAQNVTVSWKKVPYNISAWNVSNCDAIEYVLPDEETLKNYDFSPSYTIISAINIKNPSQKVETKVIVGNNAEIYMSLENLYLTSHMYQSYNFTCPVGRWCFAPWYPRGANTLVHKLNISWAKISYQDSALIPGSPLTQYSMDENGGNFRILTSINSWENTQNESYTDLYILDKNLKLKWSLTQLGKWEQFKASRYIWDKLFLITFEQIDPLFVIDVKNPEKPTVLWELKMPWYSTYLHPYDEKHLIGIWYDTVENQWGWIINAWVKVDLYEINYDKKCGDVSLSSDEQKKCDSWEYKGMIAKQKFTQTFGWAWSTSEALTNPRMFMWNAAKNTLLLPVTLRQNDGQDLYRYIDFFNGVLWITIDKNTGIQEQSRISHMDDALVKEARLKECNTYSWNTSSSTPVCVKLLNGEEHCEARIQQKYVPKYCYADSPIWEYLASKSWEYSKNFVKRALWIGNEVFALSDVKISSHNFWKSDQNYEISFGK